MKFVGDRQEKKVFAYYVTCDAGVLNRFWQQPHFWNVLYTPRAPLKCDLFERFWNLDINKIENTYPATFR
jgi:hypothetical protein